MTFTTPIALLLLLLSLPFVYYIGFPRQRFRRTRDITSLILRTLILVLLIFALAGAQVMQSAQKLAVLFLVDVSDSVGAEGVDQSLTYVRAALKTMGTDDQAGVILFGGDAQVERAINQNPDLGAIRSDPKTGNTDFASAIRLALALFPADSARRMVVLSDGIPTLGNAEAAAELARASGVQISYVPRDRAILPDVRVTDFTAPVKVQEGQQFDLSVSIASDVETDAQIVILAGGNEIFRDQTTLQPGMNNRTLTLQGTESGFRDFQVIVEPAIPDGFYQNNSLATFSQIVGQSRVLLVARNNADVEYLHPALTESGLVVDRITPQQLPIGVAGLAEYESVILTNIPAPDLSNRQMQALQTYVRDLGGGLVVVGGENAYGPGGYFQTPLEDALPVEMQLKDQQRIPKLTIAYVIDRSGSMMATGSDGVSNLELAKEAINRSLALLQPTDRAAIASFDSSAFWVAEFQDVNDQRRLQQLVGTLTADGGTDILAGLNLVAKDIVNEQSAIRHIILLSDGEANPSQIVELTSTLFNDHNVTTSSISMGGASSLMQQIAKAGNGNYHIAQSIGSIPSIFAQETVLASRAYIFEEPFVPTLTARNPIMDGINALPPLLGYIGVTPKTAAQVVLRAPNEFNDPILAAWQYGLGRSVAFTSDATARWGVNWVSWADYTRFWSQAVRWSITEGSDNNIESRVVMDGNRARILVDARDNDGGFLDGLTLQTAIIDPQLGTVRVPLRQVAPGQYEADFTPPVEGAYLLRISGTGVQPNGDPLDVNQTTGWVMGYSAEYADTPTQPSVLPSLAQITRGELLGTDYQRVFNRDVLLQYAYVPIAPLLLLLALLLLPFDIAVRRLIVTQSDLRKLREAIMTRLNPTTGNAPLAPTTARMSSLMDARNRARQSGETESVSNTKPQAPVAPPHAATPSTKPPAAKAPAATPAPQEDGANLGAKLLQKRRQRSQDD